MSAHVVRAATGCVWLVVAMTWVGAAVFSPDLSVFGRTMLLAGSGAIVGLAVISFIALARVLAPSERSEDAR